MTPQEKLEWFWAFGQVPGTVFDDLNDWKPKEARQPHPRHTKHLRLDLSHDAKKQGKTGATD